MKPETASPSQKSEVDSQKEGVVQSEVEEVQNPELSEDQNTVLNLLKANSPIDLNELKGQTGLTLTQK